VQPPQETGEVDRDCTGRSCRTEGLSRQLRVPDCSEAEDRITRGNPPARFRERHRDRLRQHGQEAFFEVVPSGRLVGPRDAENGVAGRFEDNAPEAGLEESDGLDREVGKRSRERARGLFRRQRFEN
jgi:hypothetical protein